MTVLTEIPLEFESYLRDKTLQKLPTNLNEFIFAYIPNLDLSVDIDRNSTIPDVSLIVHKAPVANVGKTGENALVYSAIIDSTVPEFTFNAIYLHDKNESNSCGMIIHQQDETKQQAMTITKSALMQYDSAAASANVTIDAETWQVDISDLFAACSKVGHTHTLNEVGGSNPNLFINSDFSVCQRYTNSTDTKINGHFFYDGWLMRSTAMTGGTFQYSHKYNAEQSHSYMSVSGATSFWYQVQKVELTKVCSDKITVSYKIQADVTEIVETKVVAYWSDRVTCEIVGDVVRSDVITLSSDKRQEFIFTIDVPQKPTSTTIDKVFLEFQIEISGSNREALPDGIYRFFDMKSEWGDVATQSIPDDTAANLMKCRKRFWKGNLAGNGGFQSQKFNKYFFESFQIPIEMQSAIPSIRLLSGSVYNQLGRRTQITPNQGFKLHSVSNDTFIVEFNADNYNSEDVTNVEGGFVDVLVEIDNEI